MSKKEIKNLITLLFITVTAVAAFMFDKDMAVAAEGTSFYTEVLANSCLREAPAKDSRQIGAVKKGTRVLVLDDAGSEYSHIRFDDFEGYIFTGCLDESGKKQAASSINPAVQENISVSDYKSAVKLMTSVDNMAMAETVSAVRDGVASMHETPAEEKAKTSGNISGLAGLLGGAVPAELQYEMAESAVAKSIADGKNTNKKHSEALHSGEARVFEVTAYCPCRICCGKFSAEVTGCEQHTATGTIPASGRTVAVDPSVIPFGKNVTIEGLGTFVAEDCGGAVCGDHIDVFFETHEEAVNFGRKKLLVTVD